MEISDKETVFVTFVNSWEFKDRIKYVLMKKMPHKIYFIKDTDSEMFVGTDTRLPKERDFRDDIIDIVSKSLPEWVSEKSQTISIPFSDFQGSFSELIRILSEEKGAGNDAVIIPPGAGA